jgi:hypothetical protein
MAYGRYFCFERGSELDETIIFTYSLQVWLSIFGFSFAGFTACIAILRWSLMNSDSFIYSITGGLAALLIGMFGLVILYSGWRLLKLFYFGFKGQVRKYNSNTPENVLKAFRPLKNTEDLEEYKAILKNKIDENCGLIREYYDVINQLENTNNNKKNNSLKKKR